MSGDDNDESAEGRSQKRSAREVIEEAEFEAEGWDELEDPEQVSRLLKALEGVLPDVVRRALAAGVDGWADREEKIRTALEERQLTREAAGSFVKHADSLKREILRIVSKEIRDFLEHMDFSEELAEMLTKLSLEARVELRFIPNKDAVQPKASGKFSVKGPSGEEPDGEDADSEDEEPSDAGADESEEASEAD